MDYVGHVIRPPSEAYSMIIQVTVGCSHNMCTFCGTYKDEKFRFKDMGQIKRDIDEMTAARHRFKKAFLADGDVLILPTEKILEIMSYIKDRNPSIERIGVYGNAKAIIKKSPQELEELRSAGLGIIYQGIESGNKEVLRKIKKGAFPHRMIETAHKVIDAGILLSQTVLLGIGGTELSREHAIDTGKLLGEMSPDYAGALTVMVLPNTELYPDYQSGKFQLPDKFGLLEELKHIINNMNVQRKCYFASNHASNYLPIRATFPDEQAKVLAMLNEVLKKRDESMLKPEHMRAL
ncbi:MAG: radical SAM protein [bacterium]|nr:radical SAM protein [bacterium]